MATWGLCESALGGGVFHWPGFCSFQSSFSRCSFRVFLLLGQWKRLNLKSRDWYWNWYWNWCQFDCFLVAFYYSLNFDDEMNKT